MDQPADATPHISSSVNCGWNTAQPRGTLDNFIHFTLLMGSGGRAVERRTVKRGDCGSIPPAAVSKRRQFRSPHSCLCLSEETIEAGFPSIWCLCQGK